MFSQDALRGALSAAKGLANKGMALAERGAEIAQKGASHALSHGKAAVARVRAELERPVQIERYKVRVTRLLAEGGYSFVYIATDMETNELYALKRVLAHDAETLRLAEEEIRVMKSLPPHPLIVRLYASAILPSQQNPNQREVFMLMELCSGGHLVDIIGKRNGAKFPPGEALQIFHQVCLSVAHLHCQSPPIAHRDLKVENVIRHENGDYKLCDFGSCTTRAKKYLTRQEMLDEEDRIQRFSTMMYRAPEMCDLYRKDLINEKVDIWALGCILYTIVFFQQPFDNAGPSRSSTRSTSSPRFAYPSGIPVPPSSRPEGPSVRAAPESINQLIRFLLNPDPPPAPTSSRRVPVLQRLEAVMKEVGASSLPVRSRTPLPALRLTCPAAAAARASPAPAASPSHSPSPKPPADTKGLGGRAQQGSSAGRAGRTRAAGGGRLGSVGPVRVGRAGRRRPRPSPTPPPPAASPAPRAPPRPGGRLLRRLLEAAGPRALELPPPSASPPGQSPGPSPPASLDWGAFAVAAPAAAAFSIPATASSVQVPFQAGPGQRAAQLQQLQMLNAQQQPMAARASPLMGQPAMMMAQQQQQAQQARMSPMAMAGPPGMLGGPPPAGPAGAQPFFQQQPMGMMGGGFPMHSPAPSPSLAPSPVPPRPAGSPAPAQGGASLDALLQSQLSQLSFK
eukprot:tig00000492_g1466.t1